MSDEKISTSTLLKRLFKTASISRFVKHYDSLLMAVPFDRQLADLCLERNTVPERVIKKSGIERTYGHQLFNGRRKPSRDKVIQLAFGFEMDYDQTQELLKPREKACFIQDSNATRL